MESILYISIYKKGNTYYSQMKVGVPPDGQELGTLVFSLNKMVDAGSEASIQAYEQLKTEALAEARKRGISHVINLDPDKEMS